MSSPQITIGDLRIAIESNLTEVVKSYISYGEDPNQKIYGYGMLRIDDLALLSLRDYNHIPPIHVSAVSCLRTIMRQGSNDDWESAIGILDSLIAAGAKLNMLANLQARVGQITEYWNLSPLSLTLKVIEKHNHLNGSDWKLRELTEKLAPSTCALLFPKSIPTVTIPQSVATTYKNLLFSPDQSDIKFVCKDGEILPAHKIILDAASPYFRTAFHGPWVENMPEGEWHTSHSSSLIKAVLTYIYTGDISDSLVGETLLEVLSIAGEYDIPSLKELAAFHCVRSISVANFKKMVQFAYIHDIENLKTACCAFLKTNCVAVLKNPGVMSLPTESPDLWAELTADIAP